MNYLILFLIIVISSEFIIKTRYIFLFNSLIKLIKNANKVIIKKNISDHWKEKVIPEYSYQMMKVSLFMLLIMGGILSLIFIIGFLYNDFTEFIFTVRGLAFSILFTFFYIYLKNVQKN